VLHGCDEATLSTFLRVTFAGFLFSPRLAQVGWPFQGCSLVWLFDFFFSEFTPLLFFMNASSFFSSMKDPLYPSLFFFSVITFRASSFYLARSFLHRSPSLEEVSSNAPYFPLITGLGQAVHVASLPNFHIFMYFGIVVSVGRDFLESKSPISSFHEYVILLSIGVRLLLVFPPSDHRVIFRPLQRYRKLGVDVLFIKEIFPTSFTFNHYRF